MRDISYNTPILLLTFTRLNTTIRVFEQIKAQKPKYLFWASDGPRPDRPDDIEKIEAVKKHILGQLDWDCELKTLFREENLGCGVAPYQAITWFFEQIEQGIILEDDCLPLPGFFEFCQEMLDHYKDHESIYGISGTNLQGGIKRGNGSYYFSNHAGIWGWASWARAWKHYDYHMADVKTFLAEKKIEQIFTHKQQHKYWTKQLTEASKLGTWWDYQWLYSIWKNNGKYIIPNANLIKNIGFDNEGTHTTAKPVWYEKAISGTADISNITHPDNLEVNAKADLYIYKNYISTGNLLHRLIKAIKRRWPFN